MKPGSKNNIKRNIYFIFLSFFSTLLFSQTPDFISYQTIIRNSNNELVSNTTISVRISILSGSAADVPWYQEEHTVKTNLNGLAYLIIGKGTNLNGTMLGIDWSKGPFYIKSETDPNGGKNYSLIVVSQLLSVPFAIFSKSAEKLTGPILELDPQFNASIAKGITAADTALWNNKLDSFFNNSITIGITAVDTAHWNNKLSSFTETDPQFNSSVAKGITAAHTKLWSTELDPIFNNSISKGITSADTAAWNKILYLSDNIVFTSGKSIKLNISDTFTMLSNYRTGIENKMNISDTASMLVNYRNGIENKMNISDTASMLRSYRNGITTKMNISDTASMLVNYRNGITSKMNVSDTASMLSSYRNGITSKMNISDTASMLTNYRNGITSKMNISDTASMLRSYRNGITTKMNISDTASMLVNYRNSITSKMNVSDTASMLLNYRNGITSKMNISDTASMLSSYRNGITTKMNISDTASMLSSYRNGITSKMNISDTASMLSSYRNGIENKMNISDTASMLNSYRNGITSKMNISDTASMLSSYRNSITSKMNVSDTASMLSSYQTSIENKVNIGDTSNMLFPYLRKADLVISELQNQIAQLSSQISLLSEVITDIDGNSYGYVAIGNQKWLSDNLRVSRYNNGDPILIVSNNTDWSNLITGARCWYFNDSITYEFPYGNLYNWYAVTDNRGICPVGWHVPSDTEWTTLTTHLGGEAIAGAKLKSNGLEYWNTPNTSATNERDFSALPGGYNDDTGNFLGIRNDSFFWSSSFYNSDDAWSRSPYISSAQMYKYFRSKKFGFSIRCLKN